MAATGLVGFSATAAHAAAGTPPNCFGESVAMNAQAITPYGQFVVQFVPVNGPVAEVKAGLVPDDIFANTCNDA